MIPILYASNEKDFSHNGIGFLRDMLSCEVTEERNGVFEITFTYPVDGQHAAYLAEEMLVKATANETAQPQLFRLYKSSKPMNGVVVWNGEHVSYLLNGNPLPSFSVKSGSAGYAINKALTEATFEHGFSAWSDIDTLNSTEITEPVSVRAVLGGTSGSVLDTWGGEYEFDNHNIKLHAARGAATDIVIEYGKNLTDINQERNIEGVYTALFPYAKYTTEEQQGEEVVTTEHILTLSEKIIASPNASAFSHSRALILDLSGEFGESEEITEAKLRQKAAAYMNRNPIDVPRVNIKVSFVQLWQTEEYKNIAPLERVRLCDTVKVKFSKLGITASAKVIKTRYDTLKERYIDIELGDARANFADTMNGQQNDIKNTINAIQKSEVKTSQAIKNAILRATNLITGNSGGYVVLHPAENPQEILIMDTPDIATALNVWRWNSSGLGHSSTGYNGEYGLAMTIGGAINAYFITVGELNGSLLKAGSVSANAISVEYKQTVTDAINQSAQEITQSFQVADQQLLSTISEKFTDYSTTTQMNSAISQTSSTIMFEVNKKVNNADFGTKITQNYYSVQIAWNTISKYIEFSGGAMNIYQSTAQGSGNLLMKMNYSGAWYYYNGTTIGKIGTNAWSGDSSFRGLVFDLEYGADYMCWAHRTSSGAGSYTVQMIYYANNSKARQGLHFSCDTYCWGFLNLNENVRTVNWSGGGAGLYSTTHEVGIFGKTAKLSGGCSFECTERRFAFWNSPDLMVDCYNNIDIHNYSILNQSDARLKTNIAPTAVSALELINRIQLKEFDWIETGEHEEIGIIAQQLQEIIPGLVAEDSDTGRLSIRINRFIPYLIKAIQEAGAISQPPVLRAATPELWQDDMTLEEKQAFIQQTQPPAPEPQTEIVQESIILPKQEEKT